MNRPYHRRLICTLLNTDLWFYGNNSPAKIFCSLIVASDGPQVLHFDAANNGDFSEGQYSTVWGKEELVRIRQLTEQCLARVLEPSDMNLSRWLMDSQDPSKPVTNSR